MTEPLILTRGASAEPGSSLAFRTGDWRTSRPVHVHGAAPCHLACPAGEDAQAWIAPLQAHDPRAAWEALVAVNPLPAITGRVCPHPCESGCNRGAYDSAVNIHGLERWLGDRALAEGWPLPAGRAAHASGFRVAVVGAGPAGLAAAYHLRRRGHAVTLYDALAAPGGLLRTAIPPYRLPRAVVDAEIGRILALGVEFIPHARIGSPGAPDLAALRAGHDAVFLAIGAERGRPWSIQGAVPENHHTALDLLKAWTATGALPAARAVAIHGGGNTAVDLARLFRRAGVAEVHIVTASGLPDSSPDLAPDLAPDPTDVLNVVPREYAQAVEEGVIFHPHRTLNRLLFRGSHLMGAEMVTLRKLPGPAGGSARVAFEGTETILHVDLVVPAIGESVDPRGFETLLPGNGGAFSPRDPTGRLETGLYAGGDARAHAGGTVAAAVGDGRRAAAAIDAELSGGAPADTTAESRPPVPFSALNTAYHEPLPRHEGPVLPVERRVDDLEIDGALAFPHIQEEADRCLSCGNCLACDNCWTLCPDAAVLKTRELASDGSHYRFDYDYCKGCGLCARECPCGFIAMVEDH